MISMNDAMARVIAMLWAHPDFQLWQPSGSEAARFVGTHPNKNTRRMRVHQFTVLNLKNMGYIREVAARNSETAFVLAKRPSRRS